MNEKRVGILLSYALVFVNALSGILFTSILLGNLEESAYGLYKLAMSWTSMIAVLDFGLGGTITRYVLKYRSEKDAEGERRFLGMAFFVYAFLAVLVLVVGTAACYFLPFFSGSIPQEQVPLFRWVMLFLVGKNAVLLFNHAYTGRFVAHGRFVYIKASTLVSTVVRVLLAYCLLPMAPSAVTVVAVDLGLSLLQLLSNMVARKACKLDAVRFCGWDKPLLKEIFVYTSSVFVASIINQFNGNVDVIVLGVFSTATAVGLYASVMQIYTVYCSLSTAVQEIFMPQVSKTVFEKKSDDEITRSIVAPSRLQIVVLGLALTGFIHFGYDFLAMWLGDAYDRASLTQGYYVGILVMISAFWQLFQNSATNILKAKNLLAGKVRITAIATAANFLITMLLVPVFGMLGAAAGTAAAMVLGYGVATNIYYHRVVNLNLKLYYKETFRGLWWSIPLAFLVGFLVRLIPGSGAVWFLVKAALYAAVYFVAIVLFGFKKEERQVLGRLVKR